MGADLILSKIDRAFSNDLFLMACDTAWIDIIPNQVSDHRILSVNISHSAIPRFYPFHHINAWPKLDGYKEDVACSWNIVVDGPPMFRVIKKLKEVRSNVSTCNKR